MIIGYAVNHYLQDFVRAEFNHHENVLKNYWIIIDIVILFLGQTYISTNLYMKVAGEVQKNIYSLYFLQ